MAPIFQEDVHTIRFLGGYVQFPNHVRQFPININIECATATAELSVGKEGRETTGYDYEQDPHPQGQIDRGIYDLFHSEDVDGEIFGIWIV